METKDERFVWDLTPEEDKMMLQRAREEEAFNKGFEQGLKQCNEMKQIVINMLNKNYSLKEISEITGLSIDNFKKYNKTRKKRNVNLVL